MCDYGHVLMVRCTRWDPALCECANKRRRTRLRLILLALTLLPMLVLAQETNLSLADIEAAIEAGMSLSAGDVSDCGIAHGDGGIYDQSLAVNCSVAKIGMRMLDWGAPYVRVFTPVAWIEFQAYRAKQEFRELDPADVDADNVLRVFVHPVRDTDKIGESVPVKHVVLQSEDKQMVVQPISVERYEIVVKNRVGFAETYYGLKVLFRIEDLARIRATSHDREFFITVIAESGDRRLMKVKKNRHFKHLP